MQHHTAEQAGQSRNNEPPLSNSPGKYQISNCQPIPFGMAEKPVTSSSIINKYHYSYGDAAKKTSGQRGQTTFNLSGGMWNTPSKLKLFNCQWLLLKPFNNDGLLDDLTLNLIFDWLLSILYLYASSTRLGKFRQNSLKKGYITYQWTLADLSELHSIRHKWQL